MRYGLILLLTGHWLSVSAQDWALINPAYKYNYSNDGSDTISNQIFVTDIDTMGPDSFLYELNKVVAYCWSDTEFVHYIDLAAPQFLMERCEVTSDRWTFLDTVTYSVPHTAPLGFIWNFNVNEAIPATIISAGTTMVLGDPDSIKVMVSVSGDTVIWSKAHGVVLWHLSNSSSYTLVGIHGPDLGTLIPSLSDLYPYQAGDVVEYRTGYWSTSTAHQTVDQYQITGRFDYPDSIVFTATHLWTFQPEWTWIMWGSDNEPLKVSANSIFLFPASFSHPGAFIRSVTYPNEGMITRHGINSSGYYQIRNEVASYFSALPLVNVIDEPDSACAAVYPLGNTESYWMMDAEVGFRGYMVDQVLEGHYRVLTGAIIDGVQIGNLTLHVGMLDGAVQEQRMLYPNPVVDDLFVDHGSSTRAYRVVDIQGRTRLTGLVGTGREKIRVSSLSSGLYFLCFEEEPRLPFVILH